MKISPRRPSSIFAGAQIDLVAADDRLLGVALAAVRQLFALAVEPLDDALDDLLGDRARRARRRAAAISASTASSSSSSSSSASSEALSGWRELGAVAVERVGLQRQLPGQHVGLLAVLDGRVVGHVDGLGDGARDEGLRRRHHADVALDREVALADLAAGIGAVEHRQVLGLEEAARLPASSRRRHGCWRPRCPSCEKPRCGSRSKAKSSSCSSVKPKRLRQEVGAERPLVEDELDVEGRLRARR